MSPVIIRKNGSEMLPDVIMDPHAVVLGLSVGKCKGKAIPVKAWHRP